MDDTHLLGARHCSGVSKHWACHEKEQAVLTGEKDSLHNGLLNVWMALLSERGIRSDKS